MDQPPAWFDLFDAIAFERQDVMITCEECIARAALALATPAERCPYCRLRWEEHAVDAPMVGCPIVAAVAREMAEDYDEHNDVEREP